MKTGTIAQYVVPHSGCLKATKQKPTFLFGSVFSLLLLCVHFHLCAVCTALAFTLVLHFRIARFFVKGTIQETTSWLYVNIVNVNVYVPEAWVFHIMV